MVKLNCQNCNGMLEIDIENMILFCPYCGQKLLFDGDQMNLIFEQKEQTKRAQEKTKREQEKTKREQEKTKRSQEQTKRLDMEQKHQEKKKKQESRSSMLSFFACIAVVLIAIGGIFVLENRTPKEHITNGEIKISFSSEDLIGERYETVVKILEKDGFENIDLVGTGDLILGIVSKEGTVKSVSIDGAEDFVEGAWFSKDAIITVTYHTYK